MAYTPPNRNGIATADNAPAVTLPVHTITGTSVATPALNYEFLTGTTNGWFDALGYTWVSFTLIPSSATSGVVTFEGTNDPSVTTGTNTIQAQTPGGAQSTTASIAGSTVLQYFCAITTRYIRVRVSTAASAGSAIVSATFRQSSMVPANFSALLRNGYPTGSNSIGNVYAESGSNNQYGFVSLATLSTTELTNTYTTTTTTAGTAWRGPNSNSFVVYVSSVSGTNPTMDIVMQESVDTTSYVDVYHFERITAAGSYPTPVLRLKGLYVRFVVTIGGTTPSFATTVTRLAKTGLVDTAMHSYFDRSVALGTIGNTTAAYMVEGTNTICMALSAATVSGNPSVIMQGSSDGTNWYALATVIAQSNTVTQQTVNARCKWVRGYVSNTGTGTLGYVHFTAISAAI